MLREIRDMPLNLNLILPLNNYAVVSVVSKGKNAIIKPCQESVGAYGGQSNSKK